MLTLLLFTNTFVIEQATKAIDKAEIQIILEIFFMFIISQLTIKQV